MGSLLKCLDDSRNDFFSLEQFTNLLKYTQDPNTQKITSCQFLTLLTNNQITKTSLTKISIFSLPKGTITQDKQTIKNILKNPLNHQKNITHQEKCAIGSMLGMAIGDAMGHRYEFEDVVYNKITLKDMGKGPGGLFKLMPGQWTDDTSMGLCLADSLLMNNAEFDPHDLMLRFLSWWYGGYNNAFRKNPRGSCGLGGNIRESFKKYLKDREPYTKAGNKNTSGNGSLMRNAAVPICFWENIDKACEISRKQSLVTHQGDEAKECCALLTYIIVNILKYEKLNINHFLEKLTSDYKDEENGIEIKGFETNVESVKYLAESKQEKNDKDRNWNWKDKNFKYSPTRSKDDPGYIGSYAMDALSMSLHVIYTTETFEEAIIKAVNLRGDSDSVGSIVGQIAGAYYGVEKINKEWIKTVGKWDDNEIALRGYMLVRLVSQNSRMEDKEKIMKIYNRIFY